MKYKKLAIIISTTLIVVAAYVAVTSTSNISQSVLSPEEVSSLRDAYPFFDETPPTASRSETLPDMDLILKPCDLVIVGEIVEDLGMYEADIITDEDSNEYKLKQELKEEDRKNFGIQEFVNYKIKVLDTIYGDKNIKEITAVSIASFKPYEPFKENLKGVFFMQSAIKPNVGKYWIGSLGFFYLTDNNAVLSTSSDEKYNKYSGWKLKDFKEELLAIKEH